MSSLAPQQRYSPPASEPVVAVVGVGQIGGAIVECLLQRDWTVKIVARQPGAETRWRDLGAIVARDLPVAATAADAVVICVRTDEQYEDVVLGHRGLLAARPPPRLLINHTTTRPTTARRVSDEAARRGVVAVDAPFSGTADDIRAGRLTVLLSGDRMGSDQARQLLAAYADPIIHVGHAGAANTLKLVNNALLAGNLELVRAALAITNDASISEQVALAALRLCSGSSGALERSADRGGYDAFTREARPFLRKDVQMVLAEAEAGELELGILGDLIGAACKTFLRCPD